MTKRRAIGLGFVLLATVAGGVGLSSTRVRKTNVHGVGWFASYPDALAEAKRTHKPILLLSMFGHLDEDMPCANARTLRATLFNDPDFKAFVTNEAIPAWEMVRPVPHITIDMGDGKTVTRTVRGNAVMYLVKPDGKVVDAFPGVYTAKDFMPAIRDSVKQLVNSDAAQVIAYHQQRGSMIPLTITTLTKAVVESPTLVMIGAPKLVPFTEFKGKPDPATMMYLQACNRLNDFSLTPMRPAEVVPKVTGENLGDEDLNKVQAQVLANDSATNMSRVRAVVHLWMAAQKELPTPEQARDDVLGNILRVPFKDPYLGLKDVLMPGTPG
jgi:hypothetical protein